MQYKGDIGLYLSGGQVPIRGCGVFITPPTIKAVSQFGEDDFLLAVKIVSCDRGFIVPIKEATPALENVPDFNILLTVLQSDDQMKDVVDRFLALVFPDYNVEVTKNMICFRVGDDKAMKGMVNQFNCEEFCTTVKELFSPQSRGESQEFNPANAKAEEIARKLEAARLRKSQETSGGEKASLFGLYVSVISIGMSVDINTIYRYTPFQLYDSFNRYMKKGEYDLYMKIKTTPMMDTSKMEEVEHWATNMYDSVSADS